MVVKPNRGTSARQKPPQWKVTWPFFALFFDFAGFYNTMFIIQHYLFVFLSLFFRNHMFPFWRVASTFCRPGGNARLKQGAEPLGTWRIWFRKTGAFWQWISTDMQICSVFYTWPLKWPQENADGICWVRPKGRRDCESTWDCGPLPGFQSTWTGFPTYHQFDHQKPQHPQLAVGFIGQSFNKHVTNFPALWSEVGLCGQRFAAPGEVLLWNHSLDVPLDKTARPFFGTLT